MYKSKLTPEQKEKLDRQLDTAINQHGMASVINALANRFDRKGEKKMASLARKARNSVLEVDYQSEPKGHS